MNRKTKFRNRNKNRKQKNKTRKNRNKYQTTPQIALYAVKGANNKKGGFDPTLGFFSVPEGADKNATLFSFNKNYCYHHGKKVSCSPGTGVAALNTVANVGKGIGTGIVYTGDYIGKMTGISNTEQKPNMRSEYSSSPNLSNEDKKRTPKMDCYATDEKCIEKYRNLEARARRLNEPFRR